MKNIFTLFAIFCFGSLLARAQSNFRSGLVVTSTGDTLRGYIDHREWNHNPQTITFKATPTANAEQTFAPTSARSFEVLGIEAYVTYETRISMDETQLQRLPMGLDTAWTQTTVFFKEEYRGKTISLLSYTDKIKTRYFIKEKETGQPLELIFRRYYGPGSNSQAVISNQFRTQLLALAQKYGNHSTSLKSRVERAQYLKSDLVYVLSQVSGPASAQPFAQPEPGQRSTFFIGAAISRNTFSYRGETPYYFGEDDTYFSPKFLVGLDLYPSAATRQLFFRTEAAVSMASHTLRRDKFFPMAPMYPTTYKYSWEFSQITGSLTLQLCYNFYNGQHLKVYAGAGAYFSYSTYPKNHFRQEHVFQDRAPGEDGSRLIYLEDENYEPLDKLQFSFPIKAGVTVYNKLDGYLFVFTHPTYLSSHPRYNYSVYTNAVGIGANYRFGK